MSPIVFCKQCSAPRRLGDKACPYCGILFEDRLFSQDAEVKPASAQTERMIIDPVHSFLASEPAPSAPAAERVIGIIPYASRHKGFLGLDDDYGNLVVTDQQLVFAVATEALADKMNSEIEALQRAHTRGWRNLFLEWDWRAASWRPYLSQTIETTLAENQLNASIRLAQVKAVKVALDDDDDDPTLDDLEIMVETGKVHISLSCGDGHIALPLLRRVLGKRVDTY